MTVKNNIVHVYPNLNNLGGAQKVMIQLKNFFGGKVYSFDYSSNVNIGYHLLRDEHCKLSLSTLFKLKSSTVISHHRKTTTLFYLANMIFMQKNRIIHVAHNEFNSLKWFSFFPKEIVAVSNKVKENHINYFGISSTDITVIHNGLADLENLPQALNEAKQKVKLLYAARITDVKQQVLVAKLLNRIKLNNVHVYFAGDGDLVDDLKKECSGEFSTYLGVVDKIYTSFTEYDFLLLFSKNEGLPLSFIEAFRSYLPVICNTVGGNAEIVVDNYNGYLVHSWSELEELLIKLDTSKKLCIPELGINARASYLQGFTDEKMLALYKSYIL